MTLRLRLPGDLYTLLRSAAEEDGNSVRSEAAIAIQNYLARRQTGRARQMARNIADRDAELLELLAR